MKVLVEGGSRAVVKEVDVSGEFIRAEVEVQQELEMEAREADAVVRSLLSHFEQFAQGNKKIPQEVLASLSGLDDPSEAHGHHGRSDVSGDARAPVNF